MSYIIQRTDPFTIRLLQLMSTTDGWTTSRHGVHVDRIAHSSGLAIDCTPYWSGRSECDPDPPHLFIITAEAISSSHMRLELLRSPDQKRFLGIWQRYGEVNRADPYLVTFNRLLAHVRANALDALIPQLQVA